MDSAVALRSRRAAMDTGPTMRSRVNSPPDYMGLALPRTCRVPVVPRARLAKAVAELRGLPGNLQGNWREKRPSSGDAWQVVRAWRSLRRRLTAKVVPSLRFHRIFRAYPWYKELRPHSVADQHLPTATPVCC